MKYLIFDLSNEHNIMVGLVEWNAHRMAHLQRRVELATKLNSEDDCFAFLSFYDGAEVFDTALCDIGDGEEAPGEIWYEESMLCNTKPELDHPVRLDTIRLNVSTRGFWWTIRPKYHDAYIESPYFAMTNEMTKRLLGMEQ